MIVETMLTGAAAAVHAAAEAAKPTPAQPASVGISGLLLAGLVSGAVIAAVVGALVNTALARRKSLEEERARVRTVFAEAFEAVAAYKEFPYAIRRRRADQPPEERVRLSEALREVQTRLTYYVAWTQAESVTVGKAYGDLVRELRRAAGGACREAWLAKPISNDHDMNIGPDLVDLSSLTRLERAYTAAVDAHLAEFLKLRALW